VFPRRRVSSCAEGTIARAPDLCKRWGALKRRGSVVAEKAVHSWISGSSRIGQVITHPEQLVFERMSISD